ncbi:TonB-dependent receptor [Geofilum sp. OHC36d9]|uniref:TonB-dependent receptor n=1 Tax=Geofilum sp. OHC36d9 TaxID=3458413 RepID=UPI0040341F2F
MQKMNWHIAGLLFLVAHKLCAQNPSLVGHVTNQESNQPLTDANIYIPGTTLGTITDQNGQFILRNIKAGTYEVVVSCLGYHRFKQEMLIREAQNEFNCSLKPSNNTLGEVVVTGTGTPHHLKNAPVQTELIDKKLINQIGPSNFTDLMLGVSPSFDFNPGAMGPFMQLNGLGNDYILVLIDGKRMYGDIGGQSDLNRINPLNIERIEIVKGASSALYGSEAIAGVINIITNKKSPKNAITTQNRVGSYGEWIMHNNLDLHIGKLSSTTSFDRKTTDGWQISPYESDGNELVETDAMTQNASKDYTFSQKLNYALSQKINIYLLGSKYERDVQRPLTVGKYGYFYSDFSYGAGAEYLLRKTNKITLDWNSDRFKYYYKYNQTSGDYVAGNLSKQTQQLRNALNLKSIFKLSDHHLLSVGGEYVMEELESEGRLPEETADAYTLALYAQDEINVINNLSMVVGGRLVKHQTFGNAFTPKISALYKSGNLNIRGTYAKGFKAPTLKELYYHYEKRGTLYLGNPDLDPQTSNYYALSTEFIVNQLSFSLTGYLNDVKNLIDYQTTETSDENLANGITTTRCHYNINSAATKGLDFIFNANIGAGFSLGGGYSYVDAQNQTDDIPLEGVAQNYGNVRIGYRHNWNKYRLSANLNCRFQDEKFFDDEYGNAKAYNIYKLTTMHHFTNWRPFSFDVSAGIDNLLDYVDNRPYKSHYGTISPGRSYFISLLINVAK